MNPEMPIDSYRRRVRETVYTGLAYRNPILLTWEERIVEDERMVFEPIRQAVDWSTPFQRPPLAIRVDGKLMPVAGRQPLFRYEKALSQIPLEAGYVWEDEPVPPGTVAMLDARQPFVEPAFVSDGGTLPDELKSRLPLVLPAGWAANYSWSEDRRTLLAFLRFSKDTEIAARHGGRMLFVEGCAEERSALTNWQTEAKSADLAAFCNEDPARPQPRAPQAGAGLVLQNFPAETLAFQLFDLATRTTVLQGDFQQTRNLASPPAGNHFFLLVLPSGRRAEVPAGNERDE
jgi:hypothetical protein